MRRLLRFLVVLFVLAATASPAKATVVYTPPVDAPVVDGFRLPDGPYGAGNRGLEYATSPGDQVRSIGDGLVVFAGPVAGRVAVTVLHADGLRSSYSYLDDATVAAGERVARGAVVGLAGERFHLGVRSGGTYLDPAALFTLTGTRLVPVGDGSPPVAGSPAATARAEASATALGAPPAGVVEAAWEWLTG